MKPGRFTYHSPRSLDEALAALQVHGDDAKVLAGGQSLMPMLNFRLARFEHLVDVNRLGAEHAEPTFGDTRITIPLLVRQRQLERSEEAARLLPVLTEALQQVAHPQIRNRGTICGSLAHADPAAELPSVLSVLDATFTLVSSRGVREVRAEDFFLFHLTTSLEPDELLLQVSVPRPPANQFSAFREFATRRGDFALAGVAAVCEFDATGAVSACRLAAAGVAPTPHRLTDVEALVTGARLGDELWPDVEAAARRQVDPTGDIHASAEYRSRLTGVLVKRALTDIREKLEASRA
ncbi:xanthine dehydrogenase family protein subunit M [Amycolatopsis sp. FDAARGOS 1241]|uniref:FAD binding domain-containing protein n=1 Tax=Amycolatopsis sp. FDAARGOS 1241 TaxID=2778070 RepID=UPI00194E36FA|nr:xanthine dehydrogenase family protein subunit M [Amycolatopsis sp. FDAARGOS 1241]QRP49343.1 xanthine dehydrogenase family protein subunit M [Amycolatopsis sp. FDAARGOS 1241]